MEPTLRELKDRLTDHFAAIQALTNETVLAIADVGTCIITAALQQLATVLLSAKILQRVKCCLRQEARKPVDIRWE